MIRITKDLETKDEILDIINSIAKNLQDGDIWRWELIKILVRHREGHLIPIQHEWLSLTLQTTITHIYRQWKNFNPTIKRRRTMTKFTPEQQELLEKVIEFTNFYHDIYDWGDAKTTLSNGFSILGDVRGNIHGNVYGFINGMVGDDINGDVSGDIYGTVYGDIEGDVKGCVMGNVGGTIDGNVDGNINGNVDGNIYGNVNGIIEGSVKKGEGQ